MGKLLKILLESFRQAWQSLLAHKLRSFLSVLGISIGIFCIIGVFSAVDSVEDNLRRSFDVLGHDVIYVNSFDWEDGPGGLLNYWKYLKRPKPSYKDFKQLKKEIEDIDLIGFYAGIGKKTVKYRSNYVEGGNLGGVTEDSGELMGFTYEKGRYFSLKEMSNGAPKVILRYTIALELFGKTLPIGKKVKVGNQKLEVIGVLEKDGDNLFTVFKKDEAIVIPYTLAKKFINLKVPSKRNATITVKAAEGVAIDDLKEWMRSVLRISHRLKPKEGDDFSLNELSIMQRILDKVFGVMNIAGAFIGLLALLVGMFNVANIMFVSVKERTSQIGIKKAMGAKRSTILIEFLMESIVLCLLGGWLGILMIGLLLWGISKGLNFQLYLDTDNVITGLVVSVVTGILAGVIPAFRAAKLDPVDAIRG